MRLNLSKLVTSFLICFSAALLGSFFTADAISNWYIFLNKPIFNPPSFIFGPVWTILYSLMAVAGFLVWQKGLKKKLVKNALEVFLIQLIFNGFWSIIFFGFKNISLALFDIGLLWVYIVATIYLFFKVSKIASLLLLPYLAWVSFAAVLNFYIWRLN